ncbi:hypothetical protein LCGC14_2776150 [marine sediment metagenome]|uniref:BppU N-terminal domain-containing protein n=1 Tax=marine sediment metagenome TaxID=412755 RepID=A0A0F8YUM7_9ZZZZ
MALAIDLSTGGDHRCKGALAVGEVAGNSVTIRERFMVDGGESINVRFKGSSISGDPQFQIIAQNPTVGKDDGTTGDVGTGQTAAATVTTSEIIHSYTILGERYIDVVIVSDGNDAVTVTYVDVSVKRV